MFFIQFYFFISYRNDFIHFAVIYLVESVIRIYAYCIKICYVLHFIRAFNLMLNIKILNLFIYKFVINLLNCCIVNIY